MYPKLRFKGFDDAWEQRKFDDVFNYLAHNSLSRDDLNDNEGSIKNIHYGDVLIKFGNVIDTKHEYIPYVNDNVKLENKACFLHDGDVVIADAAEDSTVGKCTEISESSDQKIVSGLHTIPCRPKNKFAKGFLGYYLNSNAYHDQLLPLMQGTKVSSISKTSLKETTIKFPSSIEEQKKVGACFHELDNLITLHQRQCEALKKQKQFFLQNMFPKEGESEPRIRFNGFTEPWEQRKVFEIADRYDNLRVPVASNLRVSGDTPYYGANGIQDYVEGYTHDGEFILVAEDGASDLKNYPVNYVNGRIWVNNHAHVLQCKEETASNRFLSYAMRFANIESVLVGGGRPKLNADVMMNLDIKLPSYDEQSRIAEYFTNIDNLITLHQRQYEQLVSLKKYLLSKMFI